MKLKYYGTAASEGVPAIFCKCETCIKSKESGGRNIRTRSQALLDGELLIDFPADTYLHVLNHGLPLADIRHCIITHSHEDHFYPEDLLLRRNGYAHWIEKPLTIYGTGAVKTSFCKVIENWESDNSVAFQEIKAFTPFEASGFKIIPLISDHDPSSDPVFYLIEKNGKKIL